MDTKHQICQSRVSILAPPEAAAGRLALIEIVEWRGGEPPCHCHSWEDELLYVLEGMLALFAGGVWRTLAVGEAAVVPRGVEHTFFILTDPTRILTLFTPAGFEGFYREMGPQSSWARGDAQRIERWVATAARYGCDVTGPHPGAPFTSAAAPS